MVKDDTLTWLREQLSRLKETYTGLGERYDEVGSQLVRDYMGGAEDHLVLVMRFLEEAIAALEREQHMVQNPDAGW